MGIKIITDSCSDLPDELVERYNISVIPLEVRFENECYKDGVDISKEEFYKKMRESHELPKTASPSPNCFIEEFKCNEKDIIVFTVSSGLSSTYNNALVAKNIYEQGNGRKNISIIDSLSATSGEGLVVMKAAEMAAKGFSADEIISSIKDFIGGLQIFIMLDNLENIIKGGRIGKAAGKIASLLSIKLILKSDGHGVVDLAQKVRGAKKTVKRLIDIIGETGVDIENRVLGIAHCNCYDKALEIKSMVEERYNFKDIYISPMGAVIGTYAGEGGIVIAF